MSATTPTTNAQFGSAGVDNFPLHIPQHGGAYAYGGGYPATSSSDNYWVDPVFTVPASVQPQVVQSSPSANATSVASTAAVSVRLDSAVRTGTGTVAMTAAGGAAVSGTTSLSADHRMLTFTPSAPLASGVSYTVQVSGALSLAGTAQAPATWSFTTNGPTTCPCTAFESDAVPGTVDSGDANSVSLGMQFSPTVEGYVTGVRFYKSAANAGPHTGSLWGPSGAMLATASFSGESASGWQTVTFVHPVLVHVGVTYTVSYYAPSGHFSEDDHFFDSAWSNVPLTAPVGAGTYRYGGDLYPSTSFANANYWVDPIFRPGSPAPFVLSTLPADGATSVPASRAIVAQFGTPVAASSIAFTVTDGSGNSVQGSVTYDSSALTATFTPSGALAPGALLHVTVSATSPDGTSMVAPATWSFTVNGLGACPCTLFESDASPVVTDSGDANATSVGVKFTPTSNGAITGVRFYKSTRNTGVHTASLWSGTTRLATATVTNESASGWQTVSFAQQIAVTAGTMYVVSYFAPNGHYAEDDHYFDTAVTNAPLSAPAGSNGVYAYGGDILPSSSFANANYWVDPVFALGNPPPALATASPAAGSTSVPVTSAISARFTSAVDPTSVVFSVTDPSGTVIAGTTSYDSSATTATFTPSSPLSAATAYNVTVSATAPDGTAMTAPIGWSFTTSGVAVCPCTMFASSATPAVADSGDSSAISVGVRFTTSQAGFIVGVRFYKSGANTGVHTGSLWGPDGTRLASVTFANETAAGWQTALFQQPVAVTAAATYVASYFAPRGHYAEDDHFFDTAWTNAPLAAPAGGNGLYSYGADVLPSSSFANANYWVDPVYAQNATTAPVISAVNATSSGSAVTISWTTDEASSSSVFYGTSSSNLNLSASTTGSTTNHVVTIANLSQGTTYYYRVSSTDASGGTTIRPAATDPPNSYLLPDTTPPVISAPSVVGSSSSATVSWTTDEPATSQVAYGTSSTALNSTASVTGLATSHAVVLPGLVQGTTYYYRITSADASGNTSTSPATGSGPAVYVLPDVTPPTITAVAAAGSGSSATVTWSTDEPATSQVSYGTSANALTSSASAGSGTSHSVLITGLAQASTYYYRVTSADASNNSSTSPVTSAAPATFIIPDTTPPVIAGVAATGSGTAATVSWTTNEASTSQVSYGTSTTSLTLSASTAGLTTGHAVALSGLAANTRYYFRVTSADASANSTTSPASSAAPATYAPTTTPFLDTTTANFGAGTVSSTYVASNGDGEVVLNPTKGVAEFAGTALPSTLTSTSTVSGGKTTVANGLATISGATVTTTGTFGNGLALETLATLDKNQSIAITTPSNANVKMSFSVNASNQLIASVNDGLFNNTSGVVATSWIAAPHTFRIEWTSSSATFYLDGVQKYTHAFSTFYGSNYKFSFADALTTDTALQLDWVRALPYATSGTFTSQVFDGLAPVAWDALTWDSTVPTGTTLTVKVRTGPTATPGATWSAFTTITSGKSVATTARYLQYQLSFTTSGSAFTSPAVRSVQAALHVP